MSAPYPSPRCGSPQGFSVLSTDHAACSAVSMMTPGDRQGTIELAASFSDVVSAPHPGTANTTQLFPHS